VQAVLENVQAIAREYVQSDGTPEARPPQGTPRNSTASSQPSNWAKLDSASVATPADVMARQTDCATGVRSVRGSGADKPLILPHVTVASLLGR